METNPPHEEERQALLPVEIGQDRHLSEADHGEIYKKISIYLMPILFLVSFVCYVDRMNISLAKLELDSDLGLSEGEYGLAVGIFFLPYFLLQVPSNWLLQRVGAPLVLSVLLVGWGAAACLTSLVQNKEQLYVLRIVLGIFESGTFPGVLYYLTLFYPSHSISFPIGMAVSGTVAGVCLSAPIAGALFLMNGVRGWRGWRWLLLCEGLPAMLLGFITIWYLPKSPEKAWFLKPHEKDIVIAETSDPSVTVKPRFVNVAKSVLSNGRLWLLLLFWNLGSVAISFGLFWGPSLVKSILNKNNFTKDDHEGKEVEIALLSAIPNFFGAVATVYIGWSSKRYDDRKYHAGVVSFIGGVSFLLTAPTTKVHAVLGFITLSVASMGTAGVTAPLTALEMSYMTKEEQAFGVAWVNCLTNIFSFIVPQWLGEVIDATGKYTYGMYISGALLVVAGIGYALLKDEKGRSETSASSGLPQDPGQD